MCVKVRCLPKKAQIYRKREKIYIALFPCYYSQLNYLPLHAKTKDRCVTVSF